MSKDAIIRWKFDYPPGVEFKGGQLVTWPKELGPEPTDADVESWRTEYDAAMAEMEKQQQVAATDPVLARWVEQLVVVLIRKGVITKDDLTPEALEAINARRSIRGQDAL